MIELDLPYPPTTNNLYRSLPGRGRVKTERYKTWLRAAGNEVLAQKQKPIKGKVVLAILLGRPDNRRRDISNTIKAIEDLLVEHRLIEDDCHVEQLVVAWADNVEKRRAQVRVERYAAEHRIAA